MKRKLGVTLLIIATTLAGTPEAVKQLHDLNATLRHWASNSLGGSFLVYAEGTGEHAALPDRYDYHQVAPRAEERTAPSYGVTADISLASAPSAHAGACPTERQHAVEQTDRLARTRATVSPSHTQLAQRPREVNMAEHGRMTNAQLAREIERAFALAERALGAKLRGPALADEAREEAEVKVKQLRLKTSDTVKLRRVMPARIAQLDDAGVPFINRLVAVNALPTVMTFSNNEELPLPATPALAHAQRSSFSKAGKAARPAQSPACANSGREQEVSPYVVTTAISAGSDGFNADNN